MPIFLILLILLAFPILEIGILISLFHQYGAWVLLYLIMVGMLGWQLIKDEKLMLMGRITQALMVGGTPAKALFVSFKNVIAGLLLIVPGVISDAIAVILLLIPSATPPNLGQSDVSAEQDVFQTNREARDARFERRQPREAANETIIEGEFRREDDTPPSR